METHTDSTTKIEPWRDFQLCGILTSVDTDKPTQPLFKLRKLQMLFGQ